jgi:glycosyltransferase involved in cell wall biosynthesis
MEIFAQPAALHKVTKEQAQPMPRLSVIVPVYHDEMSIERTFDRLKNQLDQHCDEFMYEIILVNDGSTDNSLLVLEEIHRQHPDIAGIVNLSRNFGQVSATLAGMGSCSGDCVAAISSDLQDPPEMIPRMFKEWKSGARTVLGVREYREDPLTSKIASAIFYRLMQAYGIPLLPRSGFDLFLMDRSVVQHVLKNQERNSFLQGQILSASGNGVVQIPYKRTKRMLGTSGWTIFKKIKYFVDGFVAYSYAPVPPWASSCFS